MTLLHFNLRSQGYKYIEVIMPDTPSANQQSMFFKAPAKTRTTSNHVGFLLMAFMFFDKISKVASKFFFDQNATQFLLRTQNDIYGKRQAVELFNNITILIAEGLCGPVSNAHFEANSTHGHTVWEEKHCNDGLALQTYSPKHSEAVKFFVSCFENIILPLTSYGHDQRKCYRDEINQNASKLAMLLAIYAVILLACGVLAIAICARLYSKFGNQFQRIGGSNRRAAYTPIPDPTDSDTPTPGGGL